MGSTSIALSGSPHLVPIQQSKSMVTLKPPVLTCIPLAQTPMAGTNCNDLAGAAENSVLMAQQTTQNIFASNGQGMHRFLQPVRGLVGPSQNSPAPSVFPLRNRTNMQGSPNFLLQTILRDSRQVKAEYEQYKVSTESKLREQQDEIQTLKEKVDRYQKKVLEMKLQKEVYVARESHAFKEIQDGIQNLLQKVSKFAQAESLKVGTSPQVETLSVSSPGLGSHPSDSEEQKGYPLNNEEFCRRLQNLERKMASIESNGEEVLSKYRLTEECLRSYMTSVNEKLDQIMICIMENREILPQVNIEADTDVSLYNASAEDNLEDSDAGERAVVVADNPMQETKPGEDSNVYEVPTAPIQILLKSTGRSASSSNGEVRLKHRKRKSGCSIKSLRKRSWPKRRKRGPTLQCHSCEEFNGGDNGEHYEEPPVLTLPCRIVKDSNRRPESMPILSPEGVRQEQAFSEGKVKVNEENQENKKDDALIGIKRENFSTGVHGRDFSKLGFFCLCGAKFTGAGGLYVHQVKTMENEKFTCTYPDCGKRYHYYSSLKAHKKHSHKQEFTQEVGCSRCGQIFKSKKDRQGHLDERGQTCWLSGSYQSKDWNAIRNKRNLSTPSYYTSSSTSSSQTAGSENSVCSI